MSSIADEIKRSGYIVQPTVGSSMEPMLHNRRSVVYIKRTDEILKPLDLPLYLRPSGTYVLHRILKVDTKRAEYIICGDNCWRSERVPFDWVLGIVEEYQCDGVKHTVKDKDYLEYLKTLPMRRLKLTVKGILQIIKHKILK